MKIMRLCAGFGNTMFQYATYLQLKRLYPAEEIYVDTIWFEYTGYPFELERIFGLDIGKIDYFDKMKTGREELFSAELDKLKFWKRKGFETWQALEKGKENKDNGMGLLSYQELPEIYLRFGEKFNILSNQTLTMQEYLKTNLEQREKMRTSPLRMKVKKMLGDPSSVAYRTAQAMSNKYIREKLLQDFVHGRRPNYCGGPGIERLKAEGDVYYNIYGGYNDCEGIRKDLLQAFRFPVLQDAKNVALAEKINTTESVGLHVRGHFKYSQMSDLIKREYYQKAMSYIKKHMGSKLSIFVFSDRLEWCKRNKDTLGLGAEDDIEFVDGNFGENSYRDMQLMAMCKHLIIPNSTFSWWGGYLNQYPDKIFVTPYATLPGTISF